MVRYKPIPKFEGANGEGLTYVELIKKDVNNFIDSFLFYRDNVIDNQGDIDFMNMSNVSNARFVLSIYYNEELEKIVPNNIAEELKRKIAISVGLDQLLNKE